MEEAIGSQKSNDGVKSGALVQLDRAKNNPICYLGSSRNNLPQQRELSGWTCLKQEVGEPIWRGHGVMDRECNPLKVVQGFVSSSIHPFVPAQNRGSLKELFEERGI